MSVEEIRSGVSQTGEKVAESIGSLSEANHSLRTSLATMEAIATGTDDAELKRTVASLAETVKDMGEKAATLAKFPEIINPYLQNNVGVKPIEEIAIPAVPEVPAEDPKQYELTPGNDESADEIEARYRNWMERIDEQLANGVDPKEIEGYLDSGGNCHVYVDREKGEVIKLPRVILQDDDENDLEPPQAGVIEEMYKTPLERGKGVEGLEQIITVIEDEGQDASGAVGCELVPGKIFTNVTPQEQKNIPDEHYHKLMDTMQNMADRNLTIDNSSDNLIYDPEKGFTVIDYVTKEYRESLIKKPVTCDPARQVFDMATPGGALAPESDKAAPQHFLRIVGAVREKFGEEVARSIVREWNK